MVTASIDLSAVPTPFLRFNSDFRDVGSEDFTDVDVSIDGGTTWTNVYHETVSRRGPRVEEVSLGPAGGQANVLIRFHYFGTWDWWWQVDNVEIVPRSCNPTNGGLVTGFVTDRNTGAALNGATVFSNNNPANRATTAATPDDPNIPDGFYWLFSSLVGANPFTATKPPYADMTKSVNVANHGTVQADFALAASRLVVSPTEIEAFQSLGQTRTTTFNVRNTGTAAATVELFERGGSFEILTRAGAPLRTYAVPGGVPKGRVTTRPGAVGAGASTQVDPAWTTIANLPAALSDNAGVTLNGKVYSIGGAEAGTDNQLLVYDPDGNAWTALPDMPTGRAKAQAVATGNKIYVFGGWATNSPFAPVPTVDVYDPAASSWSTLAATNPAPRAAAGSALAGGKVYLVGGCADANCTSSPATTVFNPVTGTFESGVAYPHAVAWMSCGGISDKVYCAGGVDAEPFTDGFTFDPGTGAWTPIATMPLDLWGSADSAAGGMLVMAGGVANGSSELTNRSIAYDPATNSWTNLPNASFARARAAGACGFYKFGGWSAPFTGAPESEALGGLEGCDESSDVPWLSETPTTFTLNPGQARNVTVTLSATTAADVTQPGDYTAQIAFRSNSPYPVSSVDVTMHVLPPASWGKIQGRVVGVTCGGSSVGVPAQIRINSVTTPDLGYSVKANADGTYAYWLPRGRYQVIVAKDGWVPEVASARVQAGFVLTLDFSLEPFTPCPPTAMGGV
jgi:N-acetylneuraminic acid mutarotase